VADSNLQHVTPPPPPNTPPRFDFNLPRAMTPQEVAQVERLVNGWVQQATPALTRTMDLAVGRGAGYCVDCAVNNRAVNILC